jgi:hypothetical protein
MGLPWGSLARVGENEKVNPLSVRLQSLDAERWGDPTFWKADGRRRRGHEIGVQKKDGPEA